MELIPRSPLPDDRRQHRVLRHEEIAPAPGISLYVRRVFSHFQNLNLRVLIEDLRRGRVAQGNWTFDRELCPVAHGLADGRTVGQLQYVTQAVDLKRACDLAAEQIGAPSRTVYHVVTTWDFGELGAGWLLGQLQALWAERVADAELMQAMLADPVAPFPITKN